MAGLRYRLRVKGLLQEAGISVYRLAKALEEEEVGLSTVYGVLSGYQRPSLALLEKLHAALEALLGREVGVDEIIEVVRE